MIRQVTYTLISKSTVPAASNFSRVTPRSFRSGVPMMKRKMAAASRSHSKLVVTISLPRFLFPPKEYEVDKVIIPTTNGQLSILPGHAKMVTELKPGLMSIYEGSRVEKYLVGAGCAIVLPNKHASIFIYEAVELDQIDPAAVRKGFPVSTEKLQLAEGPIEKAEAQVVVDVYEAIDAALRG